jgi:hypothetical protein
MAARDTSGDDYADDSILNAATGVADEFPYFAEVGLPANDTWYLLVGFLRPDDGTTVTILSDNDGGIYDTSGNRVSSTIDEYVYLSDVNGLSLRAFVYGNTANQGDEVEIWGPRIDVFGPNTPEISHLIHPTINPDILYGIQKRPLNKVVYKLNNFCPSIEGFSKPFIVNSITTNDINYNNQINYNENLKFIDTTNIGSYYNVKISDMTNIEESGFSSESDDGPDRGNQNQYAGGQQGGAVTGY